MDQEIPQVHLNIVFIIKSLASLLDLPFLLFGSIKLLGTWVDKTVRSMQLTTFFLPLCPHGADSYV